MFENPRRGRQARNFTTNVPKILDLKSSSKQIFSENWRWVPVSNIVLEFYNLAARLFNFLNMMETNGEDFGGKGKYKRAKKKWREEKSVLTFLWPHNLPLGPRGWIFHYPWWQSYNPSLPSPSLLRSSLAPVFSLDCLDNGWRRAIENCCWPS